MASRHRFQLGDRLHTVVVDEVDGRLRISVDGEEPFVVDVTASGVPGLVSMIEDGRPSRAYVSRSAHGYRVHVDGRTFDVLPATGGPRGRGVVGGAEDPLGHVTAPLAGVVVEIRVKAGEVVSAGQSLVVVEAMKMQNEVQAPHAGTITALHCAQGGRVEKGDLLLEYEPAEE